MTPDECGRQFAREARRARWRAAADQYDAVVARGVAELEWWANGLDRLERWANGGAA